MYIPAKNNSITSTPSMIQTLDGLCQKIGYELNCMRIGIVRTFYKEDLTVDVQIANKKTLGLNADGTQNITEFPLIRAKVVYCNPYITYPIKQGDECVMLFSDREIESWFINGDTNAEGYPRMHDKTDAVALFGLRSLPKMITIADNCLNMFYGSSYIKIEDNKITLNSDAIDINGTLTINGTPYLSHIHSNGNQGANTGGVVNANT